MDGGHDENGQNEGVTPPCAEDQLRLILQNLPDYAIFTVDPGGFVTSWTEGAERVKGWKPEEIIGRHLSAFYTPDQVAAGLVEQELEEAAKTGRAERETWRVRKGGKRFWGNEIATAVRDADGKLLGFTKITRDLTQRKQMEDALREAEERNRSILENARDFAIFITDPQGRVATWNTGAERIFGYAEGEIVGQDGSVLFTPEQRTTSEHQKELATAASEGRASDDRWQMRKGGERFFASGITTPLRDATGGLRGFVKICRDLTDRRMIEEQRDHLFEQEKVARLEAERAMTMRDEFLAVVSHELRTPLTSILLWVKMLRAGRLGAEHLARAVESIERSAESQRQLIEDLLDISRMISGKLRLEVRDTELASVVRSALDSVRPMAVAKGVEVALSLDEHTGLVNADPDRIQQVVWNLVNNAVKFTDKGGRVAVGLRRVDSTVQIQVVDTGRGINAEFVPHVFERFRQEDATITRTQGGLGLGLSISRQLVELHGGTIRAESQGLTKGATFTVELPLASTRTTFDPAGQVMASASAAVPILPSPALRGVRLLLVEDEADTREAVQLLLEGFDADVTAVESAALAVAAFREGLGGRPYNAIVSDIGMPVQNGYELIREVREMERRRGEEQVPAVALTAYAREEDRQRAMSAGFQAHVPKPIDPVLLAETLASLVGQAK